MNGNKKNQYPLKDKTVWCTILNVLTKRNGCLANCFGHSDNKTIATITHTLVLQRPKCANKSSITEDNLTLFILWPLVKLLISSDTYF